MDGGLDALLEGPPGLLLPDSLGKLDGFVLDGADLGGL